jgi:hypothetical protein
MALRRSGGTACQSIKVFEFFGFDSEQHPSFLTVVQRVEK